jgi:hypothetical protein
MGSAAVTLTAVVAEDSKVRFHFACLTFLLYWELGKTSTNHVQNLHELHKLVKPKLDWSYQVHRSGNETSRGHLRM